MVRDFLSREFTVDSARYGWCTNPDTGCILPFDMQLKDKYTIIEVDGEQHFKPSNFFTGLGPFNNLVKLIV